MAANGNNAGTVTYSSDSFAINNLSNTIHKDNVTKIDEIKKLTEAIASVDGNTQSILDAENKQLDQLTNANKIEAIKIYLEQLDRILDTAKSDSYASYDEDDARRLKALERRVTERKTHFFSELRKLTGYGLWED